MLYFLYNNWYYLIGIYLLLLFNCYSFYLSIIKTGLVISTWRKDISISFDLTIINLILFLLQYILIEGMIYFWLLVLLSSIGIIFSNYLVVILLYPYRYFIFKLEYWLILHFFILFILIYHFVIRVLLNSYIEFVLYFQCYPPISYFVILIVLFTIVGIKITLYLLLYRIVQYQYIYYFSFIIVILYYLL